MPTILFASYSALHDISSGAVASVRDMFTLLRPLGWDCRALCGPLLDRGGPVTGPLEAMGAAYRSHQGPGFAVHVTRHGGVPAAVFDPQSHDARAATQFLVLLEHVLKRAPPDLLLTFGSGWQARAMLDLARAQGVPAVFWLRSPEYKRAELFAGVAACLVPSQSLADHYRRTLDLATAVVPSPIDFSRTDCARVEPTHLTFVNPTPHKGALYFAGIVNELFRRRSDIPVQVVESRGGVRPLALVGVDLSRLRVVPNTPDPRQFFGNTRVLLVPSLWLESFARVTVEAQHNGIPVLASDRGALPEVVGEGGLTFPVPAAYRAETFLLPSSAEVAPWVDTIERLFDDPAEYDRLQEAARRSCRRFAPATLAARYDGALRQALAARVPPAPRALSDIVGRAAPGLSEEVLDDLLQGGPLHE